jgi:hypothetical protein
VSELNTLSNSLEQTLKNSDLQNVTISLAEVFMDRLMKEGIAKEIPIIGTIIGAGKATIGIKESLFLKKIIYFISELKNISATKRHKMISEIDNSGKFRSKVGEKLLYIIDKCDDHEKSQIIARLFSAFLLEIISYDEFLRASHIIDQVMNEDLKWFVDSDWDRLELHEAGHIVISGLVQIESPEISVDDQWDHKAHDKYIVNGSELTVYVSDIGQKVRKILRGSLK